MGNGSLSYWSLVNQMNNSEHQIELLKEQIKLLELENSNLNEVNIILKEQIDNLNKQIKVLQAKILELMSKNNKN